MPTLTSLTRSPNQSTALNSTLSIYTFFLTPLFSLSKKNNYFTWIKLTICIYYIIINDNNSPQCWFYFVFSIQAIFLYLPRQIYQYRYFQIVRTIGRPDALDAQETSSPFFFIFINNVQIINPKLINKLIQFNGIPNFATPRYYYLLVSLFIFIFFPSQFPATLLFNSAHNSVYIIYSCRAFCVKQKDGKKKNKRGMRVWQW